MRSLDETQARVLMGGLEAAETRGSALALQNAIVDAAILFRVANREYDDYCEQTSDSDDIACQEKLLEALQNKAVLFALIDRLLLDHRIDA